MEQCFLDFEGRQASALSKPVEPIGGENNNQAQGLQGRPIFQGSEPIWSQTNLWKKSAFLARSMIMWAWQTASLLVLAWAIAAFVAHLLNFTIFERKIKSKSAYGCWEWLLEDNNDPKAMI